MRLHVNSLGFVVAVVGFGICSSSFAARNEGIEPKRSAPTRPVEMNGPAWGGGSITGWISPWSTLPAGHFSPDCGYPPAILFPLVVSAIQVNVAQISWPAPSYPGYRADAVRGSLKALADSHGDFTAATDACLLDDRNASFIDDPETPVAGEGFWYLVREDPFEVCPAWGSGSYNSRSFWINGRQVGDRDAEIGLSGRDCSCYVFCCFVWNTCSP